MARSAVFATAVCVRVDSRSGTLQHANGGHPPAFVRHADGTLTRLDPDTYLLGVVEGEYCAQCTTVPFGPGDALLAYTDGASEARNLAGEMFTIAGLHDRLRQLDTPPERWPNQLLHQVMTHRRAPAEDDTLLVSVYRA
jgi:sigma-B regulation protein RsbU (phosphoserine phosphatase)